MAGGSDFSTLYATGPLWFDDDFGTVELEDREVAILQMVPISAAEKQYTRAHGWYEFERHLVEREPDVFAPCRSSLF